MTSRRPATPRPGRTSRCTRWSWARPDSRVVSMRSQRLKEQGLPVAFVGDVVGTGSSRKSACNSRHLAHRRGHPPRAQQAHRWGHPRRRHRADLLQHRRGLGRAADPVRRQPAVDTVRSFGSDLARAASWRDDGSELCRFELKPPTLLDEYRAGGRVPLIIGKDAHPQGAQGARPRRRSIIFAVPPVVHLEGAGYSLAQKMVGRACGVDGVHPGTACLPKMTSVGSQDTTGPMTADEIKELACLGFQSDLVHAELLPHGRLPARGRYEDARDAAGLHAGPAGRGSRSLETASSTRGSTA